jgi:hypothetical protein
MSDYSGTEKFLHRLYLSNYFISKASFELEQSLFGNSNQNKGPEQLVFVTGLARSGTTALMRKLYETGEYASLTYNNMPFLFMPNLWKTKRAVPLKQRAHQDGIMVNGNSPEEFDEYFWKVFLDDSYIGEELKTHDIPDDVLTKYQNYVALICKSQVKKRYLSKNNNNILRIDALQRIENTKIIFLYRHPLDHSASLLKLHQRFTVTQERDPFITEYFNFLGHHEFGKNHKPFLLPASSPDAGGMEYSVNDINYWLARWINYYRHLIEINRGNFELIAFEDLTNSPKKVYDHLLRSLSLRKEIHIPEVYKPPKYRESNIDNILMDESMSIYRNLEVSRLY